jgi:putative flippase GtrA
MRERTRLVYFVTAGATGFCVDGLVLSALVNVFAWSPYLARVLSYSIAITATWYLNRHLTFRDRSAARRVGAEYLRYVAVQIVGAAVNYGTFAAIVALFELASRWPIIALVAASLIAMVVTYVGMQRFAFPRESLAPSSS